MHTDLKTNNSLVVSLFIICFLVVISMVNVRNDFVSSLFSLSFVLLLALWIINLPNGGGRWDKSVLFIALLSFLNICISAILSNSPISFEYSKKCIFFIFALVLFSLSPRIRLTPFSQNFILIGIQILSVFLFYSYYTKGETMYIRDDMISPYLTMNMTNSNITGMFLFCVALFDYFGFRLLKNKLFKITSIVLFAAISWMVVLTGARNCMIALVAFIVFQVIVFFRKHKASIPRWVLITAVLFPLIFAIIYMSVIDILVKDNLFSFMVMDGKELNSREHIWKESFNYIFQYPITGAYSQRSDGTGWSQAHNTHIEILVSYGIIVFCLTIRQIYKILSYFQRLHTDSLHQMFVWGFIAILFIGFGEAALFVGTSGLYILGGLLLIFANSHLINEKTKIQS